MPAVKLLIEGRVQGVGFRAFVVDLAHRLDLKGEVWNSTSGGVRAVLVADDQATTDQAIAAIHQGPGRVDSVRTTEIADTDYNGFRITATRPD